MNVKLRAVVPALAALISVVALACGLPLEGLGPVPFAGPDASSDAISPDATVEGGTDAGLDGGCGHDCAGGACVAGACAPVALVDAGGPIRAMGISDTSLFWATISPPALYSALLDGSGARQIEGLPVNGLSELVVVADAGAIYYTTGDLHRVATDGTGDMLLLYGQSDACLQVAGGTAYFVHAGPPPSVDAFDIANGTRTNVIPSPLLFQPWGVAVAPTGVYWSGNQHAVPDGGIWRLAPDASSPVEIVPHLANPSCLTVYGDALYWPNSDDGTIMTSDLAGGGVRVLATGQDLLYPPTNVAVDDRFVYWSSGSAIMRLAR